MSVELSAFANCRILVVGDLMIDQTHFGGISRRSPEAEIPIVDVARSDYRLGGAGNVAINLRSLGAEVHVAGVCGPDPHGSVLQDLCGDREIDTSLLLTATDRPTTVKTRVYDGDRQVLRFDRESVAPLPDANCVKLVDGIRSLIDSGSIDAIVLQDYNKGVLAPGVIAHVLKAAEGRIPIAVDPKSDNFFAYREVKVFKPNLKELREGLGIEIDPTSMGSLQHAARQLHERIAFKQLILTLSEHGVYHCDADFSDGRIPAFERKIVDVSGAGDTVISVVALCMASGCSAAETAALSNLAGGLVCEKVGVESLGVADLEAHLDEIRAYI